MHCANCPGTLSAYERGGLICNACELIHTADGSPQGWLVCAERAPGGVIAYDLLAPFRGERPLNSVQVATIVRIAAEVGIANIDQIRHRLATETAEVMAERRLERGDHNGMARG